ncbi:substrate-binding periplasmic protein [Thermodesulfobacteriota bacterium]
MKNRVFRLAHMVPFPPFALREEGKSRGLAIDLLDRTLAEVNAGAIYIPVDQSRIEDLVDMGRADGIAFFAITPERQARYDFSDALIATGGALFLKKSNPSAPDLAAFAGKTISTPRKGPLFSYIQKEFPQITIRATEDYPEAMELVLTGDAAAAALNLHSGIAMANQFYTGQFSLPDSAFLEINLAVAVPKGKCEVLLRLVNDGLARLAKEKYDEILEKWIG